MKYVGMKKLRPCEALDLEHKGFKVVFIKSGFNRDLYFVYEQAHEVDTLDKEINRRQHETDNRG